MRTITVNTDSVALPDGKIYNATDTAVLTDEQFDRIDSALFAGGSPVLTNTGYTSGVIIESPNGTAYRIKVANNGTLSTEVVT